MFIRCLSSNLCLLILHNENTKFIGIQNTKETTEASNRQNIYLKHHIHYIFNKNIGKYFLNNHYKLSDLINLSNCNLSSFVP